MPVSRSRKIADLLSTMDLTSAERFVLPVGNTANQPSTPTAGTFRFNSEDTSAEIYDGSEWGAVGGGGGFLPVTLANTTTIYIESAAGSTLTIYGRTTDTTINLASLGDI